MLIIPAIGREGRRATQTSHHKFKSPETGKVVIVPHPKKDLPRGTAQAILKQAGLK